MESGNFVVYKSSAGSGKTFTLVKEYLKLALKDRQQLTSSYKTILAITFTNKAASEMKWRIIKALKEISSDENVFLSNLIANELGIDKQDLEKRAERVLTDILHNYSDFSIGTIDSFTHRVIRTFALDLKLPVNFQIETDADGVFKKVISLLINNLGKDSLITNYLVQFSLDQLEENKTWDPEALLIGFIKEINKEGVNELVNQLKDFDITYFDNIKTKLASVIKSYESSLRKSGKEALELIISKNIPPESFANGTSGIYNLFVKAAELKETSMEELFKSTVVKTLEEDKWYSGKATASDKAAIDAIKSQLHTVALEIRTHVQQNEERYNVFKLIYKNIYAMGLVNELAKLTSEYKTDENILFISEFNEKISNVVNNEPTPFIFERLGDRYKHFLLDEFQDTSAMQWQNMLPLIDNSLGNGNLNLIVGDGKQSIYRWRNADVQQFVSLPSINAINKNDLIQEREQALIRNFSEKVLGQNFRSDSVIVEFNNELFEYLSDIVLNEDLKRIYHKQKQEHKHEQRGFVSLDFPELSETDTDEVNQNYVLRYIQNAIESGYRYNDICIIIRNNNSGNKIANFLINQNIPVVSADSLLLSNANEINILICFLKYISNQKDLVSASAVIQYLRDHQYCDGENYITYLRLINVSKGKSLFDVLLACGLNVDITKLTSSNLFDCCLEIICLLELEKANPQYIRFFLDELLSFLQSNTSNISLFLEWWERHSATASVIIPEGIDAVNVMTIHASKGLEFPVVITPYLAWEIEKAQSIWVDIHEEHIDLPVAMITSSKAADGTNYKLLAEKERQQQALDSLNLLYVDFTRAVERLHIISPKPKRKTESSTYSWLYKYALLQSGFDTEKQQLCFGKMSVKTSKPHKVGLEQLPIANLNFNHQTEVVQIKEASKYTSNEEVLKAREYGILVHHILSQIKTTNDIDHAISNAVLTGDITVQEGDRIASDIKQLISISTIKPYFEAGAEIINEIEIMSSNGDILRPDRVVISGNKATVIDYKTGKKHASKYHEQMRDYEKALFDLGYQDVSKILLYIHEQEAEVLC